MRRDALIASLLFLECAAAAYTASPRWGQAAALVEDVLFIHGGKTDQFNAFGYSAAPNNNDMLFLSLSSSFDPSSPPWDYVGGASNSCTTQGPAVAFHTLSAFLTTELILFGGDPGPNSQVLPESTDSAALVDIMDRRGPSWLCEDASWADEPLRRIYHRSSTFDGKVYFTGGEKVDGAGGLDDHWLYDPAGPDFHQLPSDNGPPALYGHAAIVLEDGRMLVFGGWASTSSALLPFSTIWALDTTQSTLSWSTLSVSTSALPTARRNFAAVYVGNGKIIIQGGADGYLQNVYSDGWQLDTTQSPMVWSLVGALTEVGARYDHFAVFYGDYVIFGFGYGASAPAPAALQIYNVPRGSMTSPYTPPATPTFMSTIPITQTIVTAGTGTPTGTDGATLTSGAGAATGTSSHHTTSGAHPSHTSGTGGDSSSGGHTTLALALGLTFGLIGVLVAFCLAGWGVRRARSQGASRFHLIGGADAEDESDSPHLEEGVVPSAARGVPPSRFKAVWLGLLALVGLSAVRRQTSTSRRRRDILADEDAYDDEYPYGALVRDGSSSMASSRRRVVRRPTFGDIMQGSWVSLRNVAGGVIGSARREPSGGAIAWREKGDDYDPFSDEMALMGNQPTSSGRRDVPSLSEKAMPLPLGAAKPDRPRANREYSQASSKWSYNDPFADPEEEEDVVERAYRDEADDAPYGGVPAARATIQTVMPGGGMPGGIGVYPLSPVSEVNSMSEGAQSSAELGVLPSLPSRQSHETRSSQSPGHLSQSPPMRPSSILDQSTPPTPVRRSNSWFAMLSRASSMLDRRRASSERNAAQRPLDFRDPNPPPRLLPIRERSYHSPESTQVQAHAYNPAHGKSASSLRTADSDAIERMGAMDVVQHTRVGTRGSSASTGHFTTPSTASSFEMPEVPWRAGYQARAGRPLSVVESSGKGSSSEGHGDTTDTSTINSPLEMTPAESIRAQYVDTPGESTSAGPPRSPLRGSVAHRVHAYERRVSVEQEEASPPTSPPVGERSTRKQEIRTKRKSGTGLYGLAPRASLFVANPSSTPHQSTDNLT